MSSPPPNSISLALQELLQHPSFLMALARDNDQSLFAEAGAEAASDKARPGTKPTVAPAQPSQPLWMAKRPQSEAERIMRKHPAFDPVFMKV
jgi:hypothetical protein